MSATSRRATPRPCGRSAPLRSTDARSRRSATRETGRAAERRAWWHYRLRGYRILETNVWVGGYELDLVVRRGRELAFVEGKAESGERHSHPFGVGNEEEQR